MLKAKIVFEMKDFELTRKMPKRQVRRENKKRKKNKTTTTTILVIGFLL